MAKQQFFALGQRWLSDTETDLGLGTIVANRSHVRSQYYFQPLGESRVYAAQTAPLTRIEFVIGDSVKSHEGWELLVEQIQEKDNQLTYIGHRVDNNDAVVLTETFIDHHFQLNQPEQRLLNGQFDDPKWFDLREQCLLHQFEHNISPYLVLLERESILYPTNYTLHLK